MNNYKDSIQQDRKILGNEPSSFYKAFEDKCGFFSSYNQKIVTSYDVEFALSGSSKWEQILTLSAKTKYQLNSQAPQDFDSYAIVQSDLLAAQAKVAYEYGIAAFCFQYSQGHSYLNFVKVLEMFLNVPSALKCCIAIDSRVSATFSDDEGQFLAQILKNEKYLRLASLPVVIVSDELFENNELLETLKKSIFQCSGVKIKVFKKSQDFFSPGGVSQLSELPFRESPDKFRKRISQALQNNTELITIGSWNDWLTGNHLEPDKYFGYAYLQECYEALNENDKNLLSLIEATNKKFIKTNEYAMVFHIHFFEAFEAALNCLGNDVNLFDYHLTITPNINISQLQLILQKFPNVIVELVENRGRDVLPFLRMLKSGQLAGYRACCKIHSKRSKYNASMDGIKWRDNLYTNLIQFKLFDALVRKAGPDVGMWSHIENVRDSEEEFEGPNPEKIKILLGYYPAKSRFVAGTMFWFRPEILDSILPNSLLELDFPDEPIPVDGTWAHAIERFICIKLEESSYKLQTFSNSES